MNVKKFMCMAVSVAITAMQAMPFPAAAKKNGRMLPAIGALTQRQTNLAASAILEGISNHENVITFDFEDSDMIPATSETMDSLLLTLSTVATQNEECILVKKNTMSTRFGLANGEGCIKGITVYYLVDDNVYEETYCSMIEMMDDISSGIRPEWSDVEKALYLHDELGERFNYDTDYTINSELCYTAYGLMSEGKAVCEGYAWLYNILLNREGICSVECSSDELWHIWNLVEIAPNKWAHVDVTWDDAYQYHPGLIDHKSFLKSNEGMVLSNHTSSDWVLTTGETLDSYNVVSDYDDGFWAASRIAVQPYQNGWLVLNPSEQSVNPTGHFCYCVYNGRKNTCETQELTTISEMWYGEKTGASQTYFKGSYIVPVVDTETSCIFYTMPDDIRAMYNGGWYTVYALDKGQKQNGHVFGMYADGNILHYYVSKTPVSPPVEYTFDMRDFYANVNQWSTPDTTEFSAESMTTATTASTAVTTSAVSATTHTSVATGTTIAAQTSETTPETTSEMSVAETTTESMTTIVSETLAAATTETSSEPTESAPAENPLESLGEETTETMQTEATTETFSEDTETTTSEVPEESETTQAEASNYELVSRNGDVNKDGELTILDIIIISRYLHGAEISEPYALDAADVYVDGQIDIFDLGLLKQQLLKLQ